MDAASWALCQRAGERMHEVLRDALAVLPEEERGGSGLARRLRIDRTTCQRVVHAVKGASGAGTLLRLPGVEALRVFETAMRKRAGLGEELGKRLAGAIERFEALIAAAGRSQTRLNRRIEATLATGEPAADAPAPDQAAARRKLFEAAAGLTGRWSESWVAVYVYHPISARRIAVPRAHGLVGHRARADATPLVFHNFSQSVDDGVPRPLAIDDAGLSASPGVLARFSSRPVPLAATTQPGGFLLQSLEVEEASARGADIFFAARGEIDHPATTSARAEELWALVNFPARRLVLDAYLHEDLARTCIPSLASHLWRPDFMQNMKDRWQTRLPDSPRLQVLGRGLEGAACAVYEHHRDLTAFLFEKTGLDPRKFVGYRCEVEFPVWRAGYCMTFDFGAAESQE